MSYTEVNRDFSYTNEEKVFFAVTIFELEKVPTIFFIYRSIVVFANCADAISKKFTVRPLE